jgi:hypothetical protein
MTPNTTSFVLPSYSTGSGTAASSYELFYIDIKSSLCSLPDVSPFDARAETSNAALLYVTRMTDKSMKVSLSIAFAMSRFSNVKALNEGFIVKINGRDWTFNIMMFGETTLALLAGNEPEE